MKINLKQHMLPLMVAGLGFVTLLLRLGLYLWGSDEKGLLIPGHFLNILVWILTAGSAIAAIVQVLPLHGSQRYDDNFSASSAAAIGAFALSGGIAVSVIMGWNAVSRMDVMRNVLGLLAIPALIAAGFCRWQGRKPFFAFHAVVCLYLTMHTISHYQSWSSRPQMQDYFFCVLGSILLALFSYYQTAFDAGLGHRRMQLATGLLAAFFCIAALAQGDSFMLYSTGSIWALTNLCSLPPVSRRRKNPITEPQQDARHDPS